MKTEAEIREYFQNNSDCYANAGRFENDGSFTEGEVIQAMTEEAVIKLIKLVLSEAKGDMFAAYLTGQTDLRNRQAGLEGRSFTSWYKDNFETQ